jgi:hypothetical protein
MNRSFVIEAVMVAAYGQLMVPGRPVEYLIPYLTIHELYELLHQDERLLEEPGEDAHVKKIIKELIAFFEDPFNKKKLERALTAPWHKSPPIPVNDHVTFIVVNAVDHAEYGDAFDPVETELLLTSLKEQAPVITDQPEFIDKVIEAEIPVQVYDLEDFMFAVEEGI